MGIEGGGHDEENKTKQDEGKKIHKRKDEAVSFAETVNICNPRMSIDTCAQLNDTLPIDDEC